MACLSTQLLRSLRQENCLSPGIWGQHGQCSRNSIKKKLKSAPKCGSIAESGVVDSSTQLVVFEDMFTGSAWQLLLLCGGRGGRPPSHNKAITQTRNSVEAKEF